MAAPPTPPFDWANELGSATLRAPDGEERAAADLAKADVVGLYFSAHWCPPCRGFTPKLSEFYKAAREANVSSVEIVFISADRDTAAFESYHGEQPWLALPFDQKEANTRLNGKYDCNGIPHFVLLDGTTGEVLTKDGRSVAMQHKDQFAVKAKGLAAAKAKAQDMLTNGLSLLGETATAADGSSLSLASLAGHDYVVVCFGDPANAGWQQYVKPKLESTYGSDAAKERGSFEFLYMPWGDAAAADRGGPHPWPVLPKAEGEKAEAIAALLNVSVPAVVVLKGSGEVLVQDCAELAYKSGASGFPWTPARKAEMEAEKSAKLEAFKSKMAGLEFLSSDSRSFVVDNQGAQTELAEVAKNDVVALYFSAHWCGPCRGFTPKLVEVYNACKAAGKSFEVIFLSSDQDDDGFKGYFGDMPWKSIPFAERDLKNTLSEYFGVRGIPSLVLLKGDGSAEISRNGRAAVGYGVDYFPWGEADMARGAAEAEERARAAAAEAIAAEQQIGDAQAAAGKLVLRRVRGVPGASKFDEDYAIEYRAFDTHIAYPAGPNVEHAAGSAEGSAEAVPLSGGGSVRQTMLALEDAWLTQGSYYYEVEITDAGLGQIGWADAAFEVGGVTRTGNGVGDCAHSWGADLCRCQKWHNGSSSFGKAWSDGDTMGCAIDLDAKTVSFSLNGSWEAPMGEAYTGIDFVRGVLPAVNGQGLSVKLRFDKAEWKHSPPSEAYKAVGGA